MNCFVKQLDPLGRRELGAALSEKQVSLRSNVSLSRNARRTDDTAAWSARPPYWPSAPLRFVGQNFYRSGQPKTDTRPASSADTETKPGAGPMIMMPPTQP